MISATARVTPIWEYIMNLAKTCLPLLFLASAAHPASTLPVHAARPADDTAALHAIEDDIEQSQLETSFYAQWRAGKPIGQFVDYSLVPVRRLAALTERRKAQHARIDPARLNPVDRQTWRILSFEFATATDEAEYWLTFDLTPYQAPMQLGMVHQVLATQPLASRDNAAGYLRLLGEYASMLETLHAKLEAQKARGIYMPKPVLPVVRSTWTTLAAGSGALRPADARLTALDAATRARFLTDADRIIAGRIAQVYARINAAIGADYEAKAPVAVGIGQYPGGNAVYRRLIHRNVTLATTPAQLHRHGLAAVADISSRMQAIRTQLGFTGSSRAFYDRISIDPRFIARTPADAEATYQRYIEAVEPKVPGYFRSVPKAPFGIQRLPLAAEAGQTFGYYDPPNASEPRGLYYYNGSNLDKRSLVNAGTLIYHELVPGHHFQTALQEESTILSPFRKHYLAGSFNEGWGEYAASLGIELGLYDTPETLYGRYVNEMFLAARLVVDTGMNHYGWSLEKARAYMHAVTSLSDVEIASETLRYSTNLPGQALAYRTGYDKMWELRRRAEKALGATFDIRDFHDVVLATGARPLSVLEADIDAYIARTRTSQQPVKRRSKPAS